MRCITYLDVASSSTLLDRSLEFLPGAVAILSSRYAKLCPSAHTDLSRVWSDVEEVTQCPSLTVSKRTRVLFSGTEQQVALSYILATLR
jgi:hypothetical protein